MRPSSSPSEDQPPEDQRPEDQPSEEQWPEEQRPEEQRPEDRGSGGLLFGGLFGTAPVDAELTDRAVLQALLDVERALVEAAADEGVLPRAAAEAIGRECHAERFDPAALGRAAEAAGNPVVPLVHALTAAVPESARPWVHFGATSQDVLDTALLLVAVRAVVPLRRDLEGALTAAARLAEQHRDTVMVARTLGQQASPTTFGLKAANWLIALLDTGVRLTEARHRLPVQLGGAAGTLAALGPAGPAVADRLAGRLGLARTPLPWHTRRQPLLDLGSALGALIATTGKIALDVGLLAQSEVAEVAEGGGPDRGGSSAMPHKRNPVGSILVTAASRRGPHLVATLFSAAVQEHERAAGGWHAEWEPLLDLLRLAGGAAARTRVMLDGLLVRPDRMRANLTATGGLVLAEAVAARLAGALGRAAAHDAVARAVAESTQVGSRLTFRDALLSDPEIGARLGADELDRALDPHRWLGSAGVLVDRAVARHRELGGATGSATPPPEGTS
ncbi:3-carboxy-cis,cis-muconate cycloisomerase [Micromonospora sp. NPDC050397]|uniref:3-carboxy-cis,cis-muconate cycloisomerase n=1 Tax=Micromonospora sp. NPDC050397 TaxID=3364279 RepID=UPI00385011D6